MKENKVQPQIISFCSFLCESHPCEVNKHDTPLSGVVQPEWAVYFVLWLSLGYTPQPKPGVTHFLCAADVHGTCHSFSYVLLKQLPG